MESSSLVTVQGCRIVRPVSASESGSQAYGIRGWILNYDIDNPYAWRKCTSFPRLVLSHFWLFSHGECATFPTSDNFSWQSTTAVQSFHIPPDTILWWCSCALCFGPWFLASFISGIYIIYIYLQNVCLQSSGVSNFTLTLSNLIWVTDCNLLSLYLFLFYFHFSLSSTSCLIFITYRRISSLGSLVSTSWK